MGVRKTGFIRDGGLQFLWDRGLSHAPHTIFKGPVKSVGDRQEQGQRARVTPDPGGDRRTTTSVSQVPSAGLVTATSNST